MVSLKEKIALVTGASSGVGRAIALELAAVGALVLLVARDVPRLREVCAEIQNIGDAARSWAVDLTNDDALRKFTNEIKSGFAGLDLLVHSAGIFRFGPLASASVSDLDALYRCNLRAPFVLTQNLLPLLMVRHGAIAFINSTVGERTHPKVGAYSASKHALKAIADTLRIEANGRIRVLSVMLGRTATPMQEEVCRLEGSVYDASRFLQPRDVARAVVDALTLPQGAEVSELHLLPSRL